MSELKALTKIEETLEIVTKSEGNTIINDVAVELNEKYNLVDEIIGKLLGDTRQIPVKDEDEIVIGQRTQLHPQLLSWMKEARLFQIDLWKIRGGEIEQEGQKKQIEVAAKILLEGLSQNPEFIKEKFEEWKNRSFKNEKNSSR